MKLYHKDIGFPRHLHLPDEIHVRVTYTRHANKKRKAISKELPHDGIVRFPTEAIVEMAVTKKGKIKKMTVRGEYSENQDIIFVMDLDGFKAKVVTIWLNAKDDNHKTLDHTKYSKP